MQGERLEVSREGDELGERELGHHAQVVSMGRRRDAPVDRLRGGKRPARQHAGVGERTSAVLLPPVPPLVGATHVGAAGDTGESRAETAAVDVVHPEDHQLDEFARVLVQRLVVREEGEFRGEQLVVEAGTPAEGTDPSGESRRFDGVPAAKRRPDHGRLLLVFEPRGFLGHAAMGEHEQGEGPDRGAPVAEGRHHHPGGLGAVEPLQAQHRDDPPGPGEAPEEFGQGVSFPGFGLREGMRRLLDPVVVEGGDGDRREGHRDDGGEDREESHHASECRSSPSRSRARASPEPIPDTSPDVSLDPGPDTMVAGSVGSPETGVARRQGGPP